MITQPNKEKVVNSCLFPPKMKKKIPKKYEKYKTTHINYPILPNRASVGGRIGNFSKARRIFDEKNFFRSSNSFKMAPKSLFINLGAILDKFSTHTIVRWPKIYNRTLKNGRKIIYKQFSGNFQLLKSFERKKSAKNCL